MIEEVALGAIEHVTEAPWLALAVIVIVFVGAVIQISLGMGFGLFVAPILAVLDPGLVPVSTLAVGLVTASWGASREAALIQWREVGLGTIGRLFGVAVALAILWALPSSDAFSLAFGGMIALAVVMSLAGWRLAFVPRNLVAMGGLSGLMGTITSVGAPPMAIVYQGQPARTARPTIATVFALGCLLSLTGLTLTGWAEAEDFALAILMLPGLFAAMIVTRWIGQRADARYRALLLGVSGAAALILIARGLW